MSSSCMGKELPKEKKWGIKNCRALKCPELRKNENEAYPEDSQERCQVFGTMPGNLSCCIKDPAMPPGEFLDRAAWNLRKDWEKSFKGNRKTPGPKNCPATCPYKISEIGKVFGSSKNGYKEKQGTIWKCAFTGAVLGSGLAASCPCHVLDNPYQEHQIETIRQTIFHRSGSSFDRAACHVVGCPDGIIRCKAGDITCPVIKLPFIEIKECPLWRIPAKLLPTQVAQIPEKSGKPADPVPDSGQEEKTPSRKSSQKEKKSPRALTQKEKPAEQEKVPAPEKKRKKPEADVPALNVLYLEDCEKLSKRMEPESVDLIFTDPPYVTEPIVDEVTQWERAYVALHLIASKVLKPSGFLITYAPQAHLQDIMEILAYGSSRKIMVNESGGTLDYFWIIPSLNGGATCKAHKWNALCLHKPILVYQKAPFKSPSKCFADVVRGKKQKAYHAWQQSVHDVLGTLSRFMEPGQVLFDPYACTGTTLIAGQILGMKWIGAEIDPKSHAIGIRELQQRPMDLFTFGGEMPEPVVRETIEAPKDTSKQKGFPEFEKVLKESREVCDAAEISSKKRSRIDKPSPDIKTEPADPATEARPVELHAACLDCEAVDRCMRHDPHANCLQEFLDFEKAVEEGKQPPKLYGAEKNCETCKGSAGGIILRDCPSFEDVMAGKVSVDDLITSTKKEGCGDWKAGIKIAPQKAEKFVQHCCGTCGHHKGRKTFHESCPRLGELLFKGGTKSAKILMDETAATPCEHWTDIPGNLYVPDKIRDCFGKDYGMLGGIARCADCSDHDECYKAWTKNERKKDSCCAGVPTKKKKTQGPKEKDPQPHPKTCPDACPYKKKDPDSVNGDLDCAYTGVLLYAMEKCPCHVLRAGQHEGEQEHQIQTIKEAIIRQHAARPSKDLCQCFSCPDGVMRCGIDDEACPHTKSPFGHLKICPQLSIPKKYLFPEKKRSASKKSKKESETA